ncbi:MAG: allophanate hydrolase subunit 1 [Clostridiales Family XIII bacterium]|jgi:allophanate hydrolase subunit 1|nr:allophanate hydrolase subunit 1 [Clostridiales Family XIII bacterium]
MNKYGVIIDTLPPKGGRIEILFRQAGDGFIQVEYGYEQRVELLDSFRILAADAKIKRKNAHGLIETLPSLRANMIHFDPTVLSPQKLIDMIKEIEESIPGVDDMVIESRIITLPIAFEDSQTKKAVELYLKQVRPDAPNCADGYNLEYMAICNGCTVADIKHMLLNTEWYNSGCGFWPGGGFFWPLDPRSKMNVPKYNPPRIWTPEGAVGIGGACLFTYTTATGGGYQLFGRTIPTFQFAMKHPMFKDGPFLYRPSGDRIRFVEASEKDILDIHEHVHDKTDYEYQIEDGELVVKDYLEFLSRDDVAKGAADFLARQKEGAKAAPRL